MRQTATMRTIARVTTALVLLGALGPGGVGASEPEADWVPSFNESPGCEDLDGTRGPLAPRAGILELHEPIYGPWADFYGRTVGHAWAQRVAITLPNTSGTPKTLWVHERLLPALRLAVANLEAEAAAGRTYTIRFSETFSWARYTIPPGRHFSFHAVGAALDINSKKNPYRADNVLITDMPQWFVEAWRSAGWCWGGDWQTIKDPMHFSWKGPLHTPGFVMPPPQPPLVGPAPFTDQRMLPVGFEAAAAGTRHAIADIDRDGAADVVRIEPHSGDRRRVLIAEARYWYRTTRAMGVTETAPADPEAPLALADMDRDGRPDLVYVLDDGGLVALEVFTFTGGGTMPRHTVPTSVPFEDGAAYLFDDRDGDGHADLFVVRPGSPARLEVWHGPEFAAVAVDVALTVASTDRRFALGDRNVDGFPDLFALAGDGALVVHSGPEYTASSTTSTGVDPTGESLFVTDLDGDGYGDLMLVGEDGATRMRRGGLSTHSPGVWFVLSTHTVSRLQGSNRYGTAATISAATHPGPAGVDTVFVATGTDFPDALAGVAVAGMSNAPLLLVERTSVPSATAAELVRLAPDTVVILGGTAAVSAEVEADLGAYGTTVRLAGADRYATAVEISRHAFPVDGSAPPVVLATGDDYADALSGAAAAAMLEGPVLLTGAAALPPATRDELLRLAPTHITVVGGPEAVSEAVIAELAAIAPTTRISGPDRYATSVAVSSTLFSSADRVYLATGLDFADALTGAAAAGARGAPLLLVPGTSLPSSVASEILRLGATTIFILGGTSAVSKSVADAASLIGL